MPSDYGYINARIRGQHSHLLKPGAYEKLLALPSYQPCSKWMETSPYSKQRHLARARYQGLEAMEWSLEKNFCQTTGLLLKIAEGRPRVLISIILRRWDLSNLIAVFGGLPGFSRPRDKEATLLLIAATIIMIGRVPLGNWLWQHIPLLGAKSHLAGPGDPMGNGNSQYGRPEGHQDRGRPGRSFHGSADAFGDRAFLSDHRRQLEGG